MVLAKMTGMQSLSLGVLLFTLLPVSLNAAVSLSFRTKPGPLNYVRLGDTLRLDVSYDFNGTDTITVAWEYDGSVKLQKVGNAKAQSDDARATLEGQASLVLKNTALKDNVTFAVTITSLGVGTSPIKSSFQVIVAVKPDALTDCNQIEEVNKGESIACRCYSTKGNPTPTASWYKSGTLIGGVGDSETTLSLNNVTVNDNGTYTCRLQSYNLISETYVHVLVNFAPEDVEIKIKNKDKTNNIAVLGAKVIIACVAKAYPAPAYTIFLNKTQKLIGVVDGEKTIEKATYNDAGLYTCFAENTLGKGSDNFTLRVQAIAPITTSKPTTRDTSIPITVKPTGEEKKSNTGLIAGVVIGVLFLAILAAALVYWFCIKKNECCCSFCGVGGKDDRSDDDRSQNEHEAGGREDNQYASVDEARDQPGNNASTSRKQANPGSEMPPVYAAVDKTRKSKKAPADAQQPASVTYASLDPVVLQPDSSKMRDRSREETNYASIDLEKLQSDLV